MCWSKHWIFIRKNKCLDLKDKIPLGKLFTSNHSNCVTTFSWQQSSLRSCNGRRFIRKDILCLWTRPVLKWSFISWVLGSLSPYDAIICEHHHMRPVQNCIPIGFEFIVHPARSPKKSICTNCVVTLLWSKRKTKSSIWIVDTKQSSWKEKAYVTYRISYLMVHARWQN